MIDLGAGDFYLPAFIALDYLGGSVNLGDNSLSPGSPGFKKLLNPGETAGNIETDNASGMEGTQRQLGAGLADTLGSDNAYGYIGLNKLSAGKVATVTVLAGTPA